MWVTIDYKTERMLFFPNFIDDPVKVKLPRKVKKALKKRMMSTQLTSEHTYGAFKCGWV